MKDRQSVFVGILASVAFALAFTSQASAGYFPARPADAKLTAFSGVVSNYGIGNDIGGFTLTNGSKVMEFYIGYSMSMNGKDVDCRDSDCDDWPSWLVEGKTYVTATCWQDTTTEAGKWYGLSNPWVCDQIDKAAKSAH